MATEFRNIQLSDDAEFVLGKLFASPEHMGVVLMEVAKEATGPDGIFAQHFSRGQGAWPNLNEVYKYGQRKRGSRGSNKKFMLTGRVYEAITQEVVGGQSAYFGSSADIYAIGAPRKIQFTTKGLYIRIESAKDSSFLSIGFVGTMKHAAKFKRAVKEVRQKNAGAIMPKSVREMQEKYGVDAGKKKWRAAGSIGFKRRGKATLTKGSLHILASSQDNLGYANIVQRGEFKGFDTGGNWLLNPQQAGHLRRRGKTVATSKAAYGVARPLLPTRIEDEGRIARAIERGCELLSQRFGLSRKAAA